MNPFSDFTTPRTLICPISRHFLPVEQPEPPLVCCTIGLKKGSRFPVIAHFFSSGLGVLGASGTSGLPDASVLSVAAILVVATAVLAAGFVERLVVVTTGVAAFFAAKISCGFAAVVAGAGATLAFAAGTAAAFAAIGLTVAVLGVTTGAGLAAVTGD